MKFGPVGTFVAVAVFKLTVTVVEPPPGVSKPLPRETLSHTEVLPTDQLIGTAPALVSAKSMEAAPNGVPYGALATKPMPGERCSRLVGVAR